MTDTAARDREASSARDGIEEDPRLGDRRSPSRWPSATVRGFLRRPHGRALTIGLPLVALMLGSLGLRLEGQSTWLWTDEAISVGIAGHRIADIPVVLRRDGSPPLYYLILHAWMGLVGRSEVQTHVLSLLFAVLMVPAALWAGWTLFGPRAGWFAAALCATAPYVSDFSHETRMYTLVALLALVVVVSFAHAFVRRRRAYLPVFVAAQVLLLYTHNWGIYVAGGALVALVPCYLVDRGRAKRFVRDAALAFGCVALLYVPWVPTLLDQIRHTGAPWSLRPYARETVSALGLVLGDPTERVLVALVLGGGAAGLAMLRRWRSVEGATFVALVVIAAVTLGAAWIGAQFKPAWSTRYFAALFGPVLLVAAVTLARARAQGVVAFALILVFWIQPIGRLTGLREPIRRDEKSAVKPFAEAVSPELRPGDLVVAVQMEEVPVLHYYLPQYVRFADVTGPVSDPTVVDWRDALARVRASNVQDDLEPLVDAFPPGRRLLLVCGGDAFSPRTLPWFALMDERCEQWQTALENDARLRSVAVSRPVEDAPETPQAVTLFEKLP